MSGNPRAGSLLLSILLALPAHGGFAAEPPAAPAPPAGAPAAPAPGQGSLLAPGRPLSLSEAIAMALEKNSNVIIERESVVAADANVTGTKGVYDPVLDLSADWRSNTNPVNSSFSGAPEGELAPTTRAAESLATLTQYLPTGGSISGVAGALRGTTDGTFDLLSPAYATQLGLQFRQPLLRNLSTDPARMAIRVAAVDREGAGAVLEREVTDTVNAVERAYWTLVAARRQVLVREEAIRLADEQVTQTAIRIDQGVAPRTEAAQPRAELERRRGEMIASTEDVWRAENILKVLILGDGDADAELWAGHFAPAEPLEVEAAPADLASSMEQALSSRPELAVAQSVLERRRLETALASDAVKPSLDALVTYNRYGFAGEANPAGTDLVTGQPPVIPDPMSGGWGRSFAMLGEDRFNDFKAGVVLSIPFGNRTARAGEAIARSTERQAEAELARARKVVRAEVLDAVARLDTTAQRIEATRAAVEASEIQLSAERDRYAAGLSTNFLLLTRQNDLSSARLDEIAARTDYRKAAAELERARGTLLEQRGIELEP